MARKSVDLPTPEGPTTSVDFLRDQHQVGDTGELASVGQRDLDVFQRQGRSLRRLGGDTRRPRLVRPRAGEGVLERGQTLDRRAEAGEPRILIDEEVHGAVDVAEGVRRLVEGAEVDLLHHEIERRDHHIGDDRRDLGIELQERVEHRAYADDPLDGAEDVVEHPVGPVDLVLLALEQGDLLAELADAREVEAEVRLDCLLAEHEARQRAADEMHHAGGEEGVEDGDPERKPGMGIPKSDKSMFREIPQRMIENATRLVAVVIAWMV